MPILTPQALDRLPVAAVELQSGDCLCQPEFHERYLQIHTDQKIELVEGRVVMSSPVRQPHSSRHFLLMTLLGQYATQTVGVEGGIDATLVLDEFNEPQPDAFLRVLPECGGQTRPYAGEYIAGGPEWVGEIAYSSISTDLHDKKVAYLRNGVREYFVFDVKSQLIHYFQTAEGLSVSPDREGIYRSTAMPGLWIDGPAFISHDSTRLLQTLQRGLASSEHQDFVERLAQQRLVND